MSRVALSLSLVDLPKVFEGNNGEINISLLKNICNIWPKASSILRSLIENITNEKLNPKEDTYVRLSKLIHNSDFRNSWFNVRKTGFPTFDRLVLLYAMVNNNHLNFDAPELSGFYEKRKEKSGKGSKSFPILKNINILTEQLCAPGADSYISALFAWGMIESCKVSLVEHPDDPSLLNFEAALLADLTEKKQVRMLALLEIPEWKKDFVGSVNSKVKSPELAPQNDSVFEELKASGFARYKHPLHSELSSELFMIRDAIAKVKGLSEGMVQKASLLVNSPNTQVVINSIQEAVSAASNLYEVIDEKRKNVVSLLHAPLKEGYTKLELPEPLPLSHTFSINSYAEWELKIDRVEEDVSLRIEKVNRILTRSPQTLQELVAYKKNEGVQATSDAVIDLLAKAAEIIECGVKAEFNLAEKIEGSYQDFTWNPLLDEQLHNDTWINLGALLIQRKSINNTMGICVRKEFGVLQDVFVDLMITQLKLNSKEKILSLIAAASWLTLGQKEEAARTNEKCIPIIALAQLQAYLYSGDVNHVERYSYWSSYPLNELSSNPTNLFGDFFAALYLCTIEQSSEVDIRFLTRQVAKALISNSEKRHSNSAETELRRNLCSILELHHKGGSNTYAHIWNAAYDDFFLPLYQLAAEGSLNGFVSFYNEVIADFEIEDHLAKWKQEIPEHLKKRSEYDKFIRNQVNIKISEINDWIALYSLSYSKVAYKDNPRHGALIKKICCVLDADDADTDALKSWLLSLHENQKLAQRPCFEKSLEGAFETKFQCTDISAFYPRAFLKMLCSGQAAHIDIVADAVILEMGFNTHSQLARLYAEKHLFEAFAALTSESNQEVAPSVERVVEKALEELEAAQQGKISLLRRRLQELSTPVDELSKNLHKAEELLKSHQWAKLESELTYADQYILLEEADALEAKEREILIARIIGLGGGLTPVTTS